MILTVREMLPDDWALVREIYEEGIATGQATLETAAPAFADWDRAHIKTCRLIAEAQGRVIGFAALSPVSQRRVYAGVAEVSIYIAQRARGVGAGKTLLGALIKASEEEGFWTLQSGILAENTASVRLHEACGFRIVGSRERLGKDGGGVWRDLLLYERRSAAIF